MTKIQGQSKEQRGAILNRVLKVWTKGFLSTGEAMEVRLEGRGRAPSA